MGKNAKAQPVPGVILAGRPIMRFSQALQLAVQTNLEHPSSQRRTFLFAVLVGVVGARCLAMLPVLLWKLSALSPTSLCALASKCSRLCSDQSLCASKIPRDSSKITPTFNSQPVPLGKFTSKSRSDPALPIHLGSTCSPTRLVHVEAIADLQRRGFSVSPCPEPSDDIDRKHWSPRQNVMIWTQSFRSKAKLKGSI